MTHTDNNFVSHLPLIFTYRDPVVGNGFLATVSVRGRALAHQEQEGVCIESVQPGGIMGTGTTLAEAHAEFRQSFATALVEIAAEVASLEEFRAAVDVFFDEVTDPALLDWRAAVENIRATAAYDTVDLPVESAELMPYVRVQEAKLTPQSNANVPKPSLAA